MNKKFHMILLSELRMVQYRPGNPADMTDGLLCKAVTVNVNLQSLGYVLRPTDVLRLAVSPDLTGFYDTLKTLVPEVKAKPMYPGFPRQVMEMSEAEFRLHQWLHYFSTYGLEDLLGQNVKRGWLPESGDTERIQKDTALLDARVIELVSVQEAPVEVLRVLLNRRERLTNPELDLVLECAPFCTAEQMLGLKVRFKENLELLFPLLLGFADRNAALVTLSVICQHTGDVFRCAKDYLHSKRWHLTTAEKKLLVKLLESFPVGNLRQNMIQSQRLRERNLLVLQYLDYNRFSRSAPHREAVRALRNGELLSWHGVGEALLKEKRLEALAHFAQRPGYMLRVINRLLSMGYDSNAIREALLPAAGGISSHLVLKTIRTLMKHASDMEENYRKAVSLCVQRFEREQNALAPSYTDVCRRFDFEAERKSLGIYSSWLEQPLERARDEAYRQVSELQEIITHKEKEIRRLQGILNRIEGLCQSPRKERSIRNANLNEDLYVIFYLAEPGRLQEVIDHLEEECIRLRGQMEQESSVAAQVFEKKRIPIDERYAAEMEAFEDWKQEGRQKLVQDFAEELSRFEEAMRTLSERREKELAQLGKEYQAVLRASQFYSQTVAILKEILKEHYRQAYTPLKGKLVYLDLAQFDLAHSTLETEDRSRDGGYIRSGISYRIPENARYVRFFVYWNDNHRVDVDLHCGGKTIDDEDLHVGWNADFRNSGVLFSGDITHSDAAEYIDIDLSAPVREIYANVHLFSGRNTFKGIETCYVGLMAVDEIGEKVKFYDPANCFFTHALTQKTRNLFYGYIDVQNRFVRFVGQPNQTNWAWADRPAIESAEGMFSMKDYLDCVLDTQEVCVVDTLEEAELVLTMGKSLAENAVSLVDHNFFLEC